MRRPITRGASAPMPSDEMRSLFGGLVGQAKDHDIDFAHRASVWRRRPCALRAGRLTSFTPETARELLPDLQAGRAHFAVDEDCR